MTSRIRFDLTAHIELDYGSEIGRGTTVRSYTLEGGITVEEDVMTDTLVKAVNKQLKVWLEQARRLEQEHTRAYPPPRPKVPPRPRSGTVFKIPKREK